MVIHLRAHLVRCLMINRGEVSNTRLCNMLQPVSHPTASACKLSRKMIFNGQHSLNKLPIEPRQRQVQIEEAPRITRVETVRDPVIRHLGGPQAKLYRASTRAKSENKKFRQTDRTTGEEPTTSCFRFFCSRMHLQQVPKSGCQHTSPYITILITIFILITTGIIIITIVAFIVVVSWSLSSSSSSSSLISSSFHHSIIPSSHHSIIPSFSYSGRSS